MSAFGKLPSGARLERIKRSPQYKEDSFKNASETPMLAEGDSYLKVIKRSFKRDKTRQPASPLPVVKPDYSIGKDKTAITWYGHSSYLLQIAGKNILVDPVFSKRTSFSQLIGPKAFKGPDAFSADDLPGIDILIITHDHYDHLDHHVMKAIKDKVGYVYTSLGVGSHLESWGLQADKITELDWWDSTVTKEGFKLTAAPARHFSGRGLVRGKTLWSSFVLEANEQRIFIGGDSGYDTHFKEIGERFGTFDIAILECGQYNLSWPYIHMLPEETVQAAKDLRAKMLLPVHWGKWSLSLHPWNEPIKRAVAAAKKIVQPITTPRIGEQVILNSYYPSDSWYM